MRISIPDVSNQTTFFITLFILALFLSIRKFSSTDFFPKQLTNELKGFAILAIIFSHIGYFLSENTKFLYPISVLAGVGVNLFLFLSGFGLTISFINRPTSLREFIQKRLYKLFLPLWLTLILILLLDKFFLGINYSVVDTIPSFFGIFPQAEIYSSINSPLWYFTLIFFYYILFPFFLNKFLYKKFGSILIIVAPVLISIFSIWFFNQHLPIHQDVLKLYQLHILAFPLGILFAAATNNIKTINLHLARPLIPFLTMLFAYTAIESGVGQSKIIEQTTSLITMFCTIFIFLLKPFEIKLFQLFGNFSYEIYLIHWPILLRYGFLYWYLPASVATSLYLILFLTIGYSLNILAGNIPKLMNLFSKIYPRRYS